MPQLEQSQPRNGTRYRVGKPARRDLKNASRPDRKLEPIHVRKDQVHLVWDLVEESLAKALSYGSEGWSTDDIRTDCEAGNAHLTVGFIGDECAGAMVSTLERVPSGPFIHVMLIGGKGLLAESSVEWFRSEGKRMGAAHVDFTTPRKGFSKLIPQFKEVSRIYRMDIQ